MGCGNTKQSVAPSITSKSDMTKVPENKTDSPPKIPEVTTCAKDIENINQKSDITILEFSKLSMTDLVSNGMFLVKAVIGLIEVNIGRNQLMKAVLRRMQVLEPAFQELQKKNNKLTKDPIVNLVHIVNRIKKFCEKLMATNKSLWDKFKDAMTAKSQLEELSNLNDLLTKAQADLQIPLQLETSKKIDQIFTYLKEIHEKGGELYSKNEKNANVLPMAQRCLKNEEAFVFWFECTPTKYQVPIKKFESLFQDYIEIYKEVKLSPNETKKIIDLIRGKSDPYDANELINAKQVNAFFETLPIDVQWNDEKTFKKDVEEAKKQQEVQAKQIIQHEEKKLEEKVKKLEQQSNDAENKLIKNPQFFRFLAKKAFVKNGITETQMNIRNIFMKKDGDVQIYGSSKKEGEFSIVGSISKEGKLALKMEISAGKSFPANGKMESDNETDLQIKLKTQIGNISIFLDLEYWFGYYVQNEDQESMPCFLKVIGNEVFGYSSDVLGCALWKGTLKGKNFSVTKQYITQHDVKYQGVLTIEGTEKRINGRWSLKHLSDEFYLSYHVGDDEDFDGNSEEGTSNAENDGGFQKCANGHKLVWSSKKGDYPETYGCDNCGEEKVVEQGRWNCPTDHYDICGTCRKIPQEATQKCTKGHQLEWSNQQGDYTSPIYACDPCRREAPTGKGRWHCKICKYDLCPKCRKP